MTHKRIEAGGESSSSYRGLFTKYLKDIGKYLLLSHKEQNSLARQAREDNEVLEGMVTSNLKLVVKIALKYLRKSTTSARRPTLGCSRQPGNTPPTEAQNSRSMRRSG